jgi:hypothetical protein
MAEDAAIDPILAELYRRRLGRWRRGPDRRDDPATGEALPNRRLPMPPMWTAPFRRRAACHDSGALTAMRPVERGRMVQAMGDYLLEHKDEIARVLTLEQGKPLWEARIEVEGAALYFEYYGNQAEHGRRPVDPAGRGLFRLHRIRALRRLGADHPVELSLEMTARSLSAALGHRQRLRDQDAGTRPAHQRLVRPRGRGRRPSGKGAVNVSAGLGHEAGAALAGHPASTRSCSPARCQRASPSPPRRRRTWCPACWNWAASRRPSFMTTPISTRSRTISLGHLLQRRAGLFGHVAA